MDQATLSSPSSLSDLTVRLPPIRTSSQITAAVGTTSSPLLVRPAAEITAHIDADEGVVAERRTTNGEAGPSGFVSDGHRSLPVDSGSDDDWLEERPLTRSPGAKWKNTSGGRERNGSHGDELEDDFESEWNTLLMEAKSSRAPRAADPPWWSYLFSSFIEDPLGGDGNRSSDNLISGEAAPPRVRWARGTWLAAGIGQLLSILVTVTAVSSALLANLGISAPTAQSLLNYLLLSVVYGSLLLRRGKKLQAHWAGYLLLAFMDVEANYMVVKAYRYSSITSVMLLDSWTIPFVMILTYFFLRTRYSTAQCAGVAACLLGLVIIIFSDAHSRDSGGSDPVRGDLLVLGGATLYGIANVSQESLTKRASQGEILGMLGCFGALISLVQLYFLEWHELETFRWRAEAVVLFLAFAVALFLFYTLVPAMLQMSGSALFNLSLLTSDMWGVAIRSIAFRQPVDLLYFVSFAVVGAGLTIFAWGGSHDRSSFQPLLGWTSNGMPPPPYHRQRKDSEAFGEDDTVGDVAEAPTRNGWEGRPVVVELGSNPGHP